MKTKNKIKIIYSHYRSAHSVLLDEEEDRRVASVAAKLSVERGKQQSKSAIMREAILMFVGLHEVSNGKKRKGK